MEDFKAIETSYRGYRFRSRLEARWAVFFDALNIKWSYETEGMTLSNGTKYLPDFILYDFCGRNPGIGRENVLYCEVKGVQSMTDMLSRKREDYEKIWMFSQEHPIIILPNIPDDAWTWWNMEVTNFETVDYDNWPCIICKFEWDDGESLVSGGENTFVLCGPDGDSAPISAQIDDTNAALKKARSARFEWTEQDLEPLEHEVEILQKRVELQNKKNDLIKQLMGGN